MDQHFDAERLAAFADGSLSRAERAAAEAHAADCPQCLQLLAAMARTDEGRPRPSRSAWRLPVLVRWVAPIAAAATGLALWLNVARDTREEVPSTNQRDASAAPTVAYEVTPPIDERAAPLRKEAAESDTQASRSSSAKAKSGGARREVEKRRDERERLAGQSPSATAERQFRTQQEKAQAAAADKAPIPSVPPLLGAAASAPGTPTPAPSAPPAAATASAKPAAAPAPVAEESRQRTPDSLAETVTVMPRSARARATIEGFTSDPRYRWRVRGLVVERSTDGGATWASVPGIPGGQVLAIASPNPLVTWFVGRAGTVYLWTESRRARVTFPESIDLTSVRAQSGEEAEVTTVDGRTFRTTDGGQTWSLQEILPTHR